MTTFLVESTPTESDAARLNELAAFKGLEREPDGALENVVRLAALCCNSPMAGLSFLGRDHLFFKAQVGLPISEVPRDQAFCTYAVKQSDIFEVSAASKDPKFSSLPIVSGNPGVEFYAGAPLRMKSGIAVGTLCVMDSVPKKLNPRQRDVLASLSQIATTYLEAAKSDALLKEQRQTLMESSKLRALGEMASGIGHEINNPLTIIQGQVLILKKAILADKLDKEKLLSSCEKIIRVVDRIAKIVQGLKKLSSTGATEAPESYSLNDLLNETLSYCEGRIKGAGINLTVDAIPPEKTVLCHSTKASQAILNLLNNAIDAIQKSPDPWIKIGYHCDSNITSLSITDSGTGIEGSIVEKIFEPFFTTKPTGKGTGLGLSVSRNLMQSFGGDLLLNIKSPHTCFILKFPSRSQ